MRVESRWFCQTDLPADAPSLPEIDRIDYTKAKITWNSSASEAATMQRVYLPPTASEDLLAAAQSGQRARLKVPMIKDTYSQKP